MDPEDQSHPSALQEKNRKFHVVTVHGIAQGHHDVHREATNAAKSLGEFARDCYGKDRTTNFTYQPEPQYDILSAGIHDAALDLLGKLQRKVEQDLVPSLVFIGEDLGGIIIKQAVLIALQDEKYSRIAEMASILVFVGTPHRASQFDSWESIAAKLSLIGPHAATCAMSSVVEKSAPVLENISQRFKAICALYSFTSFHDLGCSPSALTFSRDTATIESRNEWLGEIWDTQPRTATVLDSDKPQIPAHQDKAIEFTHAVEKMMARTSGIRTSHLKCLSILSKIFVERSQVSSNRLCPENSGYSSWLFDSKEYKQWRKRSDGVFWMHSRTETEMGAALSTVRHQLKDTMPDAMDISFTFKSHDDRCCSVRSMLASLSFQLLMLNPSLFVRVQALCDEFVQTAAPWRTHQLWAFFRGLLSSPVLGDIVCFIHMADDCVDIPRQFTEEAIALTNSGNSEYSFRLVVTTAIAPDLQGDYMHGLGELKSRVIQLDLGARGQAGEKSKSDFFKEIQRLIRIRPELASFRDSLIKKLEPPQEILGLTMALRLLQAPRLNSDYSDVDAEIAALPVPLSSPRLFECYLKRIAKNRSTWAWYVFSWVAFARRPLSLPELAVAVALQGGCPKSLLTLRDKIPQSIETDLQQTLGNLVIVENGEVTLLDGTLREFLLHEQSSNVITLSGDSKLAEDCLDYLSLMKEEEHRIPNGDHCGLFEYAVQYWPKHYKTAAGKEKVSPELRSKVLDHLGSGGALTMDLYDTGSLPAIRDLLQDAVVLRCGDLVLSILNKHSTDDFDINSALETAITNGDEDVVISLTSAGATSLKALRLSAFHGREELVRRFLTDATLDDGDFEGRNPLHQASAAGYHDIVAILLDHGFDINAKDNKGNTPLHLASQYGHSFVLDKLLAANRKFEIGSRNFKGWTPLHLACQGHSYYAVLTLLAKGADVNATGSNGQTALHLASSSGCEDIVDELLNHAGLESVEDLLCQEDKEGLTAFHFAAKFGHARVINRLLSSTHPALQDKGDGKSYQSGSMIVRKQDNEGNTPLHFATRNGFCDIVDELTGQASAGSHTKDQQELKIGFNSGVATPDLNGRLPIHLAVISGDFHLVLKICEEHTRVKESLDVFDEEAQTPLHMAARYGLIDITEKLLEQGAEPNVGDDKFQTPLHYACKKGDMTIMNLLLEYGADLLYRDSQGRFALHWAVQAQNLDMVQKLLILTGDLTGDDDFIKTRDNNGETLLHLAAKHKSVKVMRALLDAENLDPQSLRIVDRNGRNPLNIALGNPDMVLFLIEKMKVFSARGSHSPSLPGDGDWADLATVKALLEAIPSLSTKTGDTDEEECDDRGGDRVDREILKSLISLLPDFGSWNTVKHGPVLLLAAEKGVIEIIKKLIALEVGQDQSDEFEEKRRDALLLAAENGKTQVTILLLDRGTMNEEINEETKRKDVHLAFEKAAEFGHLHFLKQLSEIQPPVTYDDRAAALQKTCATSHVEIVDFLLTEMVRSDGVDSKSMDAVKNRALGTALENGKHDIVKLLLKHGADLDRSVAAGSTPLHQAVERRDKEMCRLLLEAKVSYLNMKDSNGRTALYTAAWNVDQEIVDLLLDHYGPDIELCDADGWTPLHAAYNSPSVTERLLKAGPTVDAKNNDGQTALYVAVSRGYPSTAMKLLEASASPFAVTSTKDTPLHEACREVSAENFEFIKDSLDTSRSGIATGSADDPNDNGETPLSLAVSSGWLEVVQLLLEREDIDINQTDGNGASLLRHSVKNKYLEVSKALLNDHRLTNLALALPNSSADDIVRGLLGTNKDSMAEFAELIVKPGIHQQIGSDVLFDIALSLNDDDLISKFLSTRADLNEMKDEHGWSLGWIQHVNNPSTRSLDSSGFDFKAPYRWQEPEQSSGFSMWPDGDMIVLSFSRRWAGRFQGLLTRYSNPSLIRSDCPIPPVGRFVFEMEILDEGSTGEIGFGIGTKFASKDKMPGWDNHSWGYHGDDGKKFHGEGPGTTYSSPYENGDTVECRVDQSARTISFTRNGVDLGEAFTDITGRLYPVVGMISPGAKVSTKFTWHPPAPLARDEGGEHGSDDGGLASRRRRFRQSRSLSSKEV